MCYDSLAESAWVVLLLSGTLDTDPSFGHCDPAQKHVQIRARFLTFPEGFYTDINKYICVE